jgi:hypothetical protein
MPSPQPCRGAVNISTLPARESIHYSLLRQRNSGLSFYQHGDTINSDRIRLIGIKAADYGIAQQCITEGIQAVCRPTGLGSAEGLLARSGEQLMHRDLPNMALQLAEAPVTA